jgi:GNAT superfamily N-acetyltransferase
VKGETARLARYATPDCREVLPESRESLLEALGSEAPLERARVRVIGVQAHGSWVGAVSFSQEGGYLYMAELYIRPDARGKGYARALIGHLATTGCHEIWALPSAEARGFYERLGFVKLAALSTYRRIEV